jgi:succinyl-CoA synthetase alpha subunit
MIVKTIVKKNEFYNSVLLMRISEAANKLKDIDQAAVLMATELNKGVLGDMGLLTEEIMEAGPNDLVIAFKTETEARMQQAIGEIENMLQIKQKETEGEYFPKTLRSALEMMPEANLVVISVPGEFAKREALRALEKGLHVFLFSSNVPIEDELALKKFAREKALLVMGPDCGTAIINGIVLGFGNVLNKGPIGIVAASGTGIQQTSTLIHRMGSGISQALGTGGRDLSDKIGGITTLDGIKYLAQDEKTEVILLISKPPSRQVCEKVLEAAKRCQKTVIINFFGIETASIRSAGLIPAITLEDAADKAVALAKGGDLKEIAFAPPRAEISSIANRECANLAPNQKYIRGLFSGGTLCYESLTILKGLIGNVYSNMPLKPGLKLSNPHQSRRHTCLDMGSEEFVVGRPHPMIDPTLRKQRILRDASDPETATILLDIVLGYGSHPDPAGALAPLIAQARKEAERDGRYLPVVASVVGTELDPQALGEQEKILKEAGVVVLPSNAQATRLAALIATRRQL